MQLKSCPSKRAKTVEPQAVFALTDRGVVLCAIPAIFPGTLVGWNFKPTACKASAFSVHLSRRDLPMSRLHDAVQVAVMGMTESDLEANLLTLDYRGTFFKRAALQELIHRAVQRALKEDKNVLPDRNEGGESPRV
jgi:hypothetical protein